MIKMRYDMFICFFISCLLVVSINAIGNRYIDSMEEKSKEEKVISADEIGGRADDTIPVVSSIDEMRENDRFTLLLDDDLTSDDTVYAEGQLWKVIELESGESIVADVYSYSVQYISEDDNMWDTKKLLPVGKLVKKSLSQEVIDSAEEEGFQLSFTDCYIDMANGNNKEFNSEMCEIITNILMTTIPVAAFILLHILGVKIGFFPPIIKRRQNQ